MSDKPADPSADSEGSISWKLIRENLARREFAPNDAVEVEKVSGTPDGKVEVSGKDAKGAPVRRKVEPDPALKQIAATAVQTSRQIKEMDDQARREAAVWFWASVAAAALGVALMVGGGIAVLFFQQNSVATLSAVGSVLLEVIAALLFRQRGEANKRVDTYREDLREAQALIQAIQLCQTIQDPEAKRLRTEEIISTLLDMAMGRKSQLKGAGNAS